jgi:hypothetical protein
MKKRRVRLLSLLLSAALLLTLLVAAFYMPGGDSMRVNAEYSAVNLTIRKIINSDDGFGWNDLPGGMRFAIMGPTGWMDGIGNLSALGLVKLSNTMCRLTLRNSNPLTLPHIPAGNYAVEEIEPEFSNYQLQTSVLVNGSISPGASDFIDLFVAADSLVDCVFF